MNQSTIAALLTPSKGQVADKRIWGIPVNGAWVPFFMASTVAGLSDISKEALGAPVRLAREKDGTPKLSKTGKPVMRVAKELSDQVKGMRENFAFGLLTYAADVTKQHGAEVKALVRACEKAGEPIALKDMQDLTAYLAPAAEEATPAAEVTITPNAAEKELVTA